MAKADARHEAMVRELHDASALLGSCHERCRAFKLPDRVNRDQIRIDPRQESGSLDLRSNGAALPTAAAGSQSGQDTPAPSR